MFCETLQVSLPRQASTISPRFRVLSIRTSGSRTQRSISLRAIKRATPTGDSGHHRPTPPTGRYAKSKEGIDRSPTIAVGHHILDVGKRRVIVTTALAVVLAHVKEFVE